MNFPHSPEKAVSESRRRHSDCQSIKNDFGTVKIQVEKQEERIFGQIRQSAGRDCAEELRVEK
jgi:hypothetical protein